MHAWHELAPLFGAGLGLDSIDALELAVIVERQYGVRIADQESLQLAVRQGLRVEELPVRMLERAGGSSFLTPLRSAFFIFKGLVVLLVGQFRPRHVETE